MSSSAIGIRSVSPRCLRSRSMQNPGGNMKAKTIHVLALLAALPLAAAAGEGSGQRPASIVVDPAGRFAYVANLKSNDVSVYRIEPASGALKAVAGSPFRAGTQPVAI